MAPKLYDLTMYLVQLISSMMPSLEDYERTDIIEKLACGYCVKCGADLVKDKKSCICQEPTRIG